MDRSRKTIYGIEISRGIAALLVVFYHISRLFEQNFDYYPLTRVTQVGHTGVDFFFVLSGFIIYFIHYHDIGHKVQLKPYLIKRLIRIFPIYWVAFFLHLSIIPFVSSSDFPTLSKGMLQLFLFPLGMKDLVIGVSWTLQYELIFYLFFALLIFNRAIGTIVSCLWLTMLILQFFTLYQFDIPLVATAFCFQFIAGALAAHIILRLPSKHLKKCFYVGAGLLILAWWFELNGLLNGYGEHARIVYAIVFMLLVIGIVSMENETKMEFPKIWLVLGKSSYSIYLTHLFFGGIYFKIMGLIGLFEFLPRSITALIIILFTVISGVIFSQLIELPITKYFRNKLLPGKLD